MPIRSVEALELAEVLGVLLSSIIEAQAQSARTTIEFVEAVGFETTPSGEKLRTVKMRYTKKDENNQPAEFEIEVPLLALVNVPSLAVKEAKLSFSYDVVTTTSKQGSGSVVNTGTLLAPLQIAKLSGFVKRKPQGQTNEKSTTAIDLDITLEQQAIPLGIERLFDLAELGILETPVDENN